MGLLNKIRGKKDEPIQGLSTEVNTVYAPVSGKLIALADFPDEAFSEGILGQGCGIEPSGDIVKAPFNGEVAQLQDSQHALGLVSEDGVELLIHVGVDTVSMNGKGFHALVKKGDKIVMGQSLLKFSTMEIRNAGFNTSVAIIVTNSDDYASVNIIGPSSIAENAPIITLA